MVNMQMHEAQPNGISPWSAFFTAVAAGCVAYPAFWLWYMFMEYLSASPAKLFGAWRPESADLLFLSLRVPLLFSIVTLLGVFAVCRGNSAQRLGASMRRLLLLMILAGGSIIAAGIALTAAMAANVPDADAKIGASLLAFIILSVFATFPMDRSMGSTLCLLVMAAPLWLAGVIVTRLVYFFTASAVSLFL